jgi:hypothetical protein
LTDQIVSRDTIRARARRAFEAGRSRDDHCMNWHAPALVDWLAEYDRLDSERAHDADLELRRAVRMAKNPPPLHGARAGGAHVDAGQVQA